MKVLAVLGAASVASLLVASAPALAGEQGDALRRIAEYFDGIDADKDGRLDAKEFAGGEFFTSLDRNRDGFVTKDEITEAARESDAEDEAAKGGKKEGEKDGKGGKDGKDGKDRKPEPGGRGGGRKGAPPMGGDGGMRDPDETFEAWAKRRMEKDPRWNPDVRAQFALRSFDRDPQDGKVEPKEYPGLDAERVFRKFDRDKNGSLDAKELVVLAKDEIEDLQKQRKRPDRYNFLTLFDIDDDRRVSMEEYSVLHGPERQFRDFDTDSDGVVTYDEIIDYRTERERRRDADAANKPRSVWDLHDADRDGRVSAEEFGGGEAVFRRLDRNRDGYLTPADA